VCIDPQGATCYSGTSYDPNQMVLAVGEARVVCTPIDIETAWWSNETVFWVNSTYPCIFINSLPEMDFKTLEANLTDRMFTICISSKVCYR